MTDAPDRNALDQAFGGSLPQVYDALLVPLIFEPYAEDLAARVAKRSPGRVLEVAAGTGAVTRAMDAVLPEPVSIVATDLNTPMLERAAAAGTRRPVEWRQADALELPFEEGSFDAVVCQFGVMFFPDRPRAFGEARRVLRPGGALLFSVWDRIEENEFADAVTAGLATVFPADPPRFLARTPHGCFDRAQLARDLAAGGFDAAPEIETVAFRSRAPSSRDAASAYCLGTPLRNEIAARDASRIDEAIDAASRAIAGRFGPGAVDGKTQAHVFTVGRGPR
jgi:SAM-dependent methyltransferase